MSFKRDPGRTFGYSLLIGEVPDQPTVDQYTVVVNIADALVYTAVAGGTTDVAPLTEIDSVVLDDIGSIVKAAVRYRTDNPQSTTSTVNAVGVGNCVMVGDIIELPYGIQTTVIRVIGKSVIEVTGNLGNGGVVNGSIKRLSKTIGDRTSADWLSV